MKKEMKLTKEQITYIDDYLKHHKVKYWDIRIELLDHIVTTVEEKLAAGISFDDALIEVHESFGNSMKMFWNSGIEYGIFANGDGYKNLIEEKNRLIKQAALQNVMKIELNLERLECNTIIPNSTTEKQSNFNELKKIQINDNDFLKDEKQKFNNLIKDLEGII